MSGRRAVVLADDRRPVFRTILFVRLTTVLFARLITAVSLVHLIW
jgi:hypothetical protein